MNVDTYLQRIDYQGACSATEQTLQQLYTKHLYTVPFENLDIILGRPIKISLPSLFEKIVERRRGGFCYELNTLFAWLLREIGFKVEILSARVFNGEVYGPENAHLFLLVDTGEQYIVDVGFGDSFVEPVPPGFEEQVQHCHSYWLTKQGEDWVLQRCGADSDWKPQYLLTLKKRQTADFNAMCHYQQTSSDSVFTAKLVCSRATGNGRISSSNNRLIVTTDIRRQQRNIETVKEYGQILRERFGIDSGDESDVKVLMQPGT